MKLHLTILGVALIAGATACKTGASYSTDPNGGNPPANTVEATPSLAFTPSSLTVASGTAVTFSFGSVTHNVTFTAATGVPADIGNTMSANVSRTFSTAGTFSYHCTIHPQMTGTIVVQ